MHTAHDCDFSKFVEDGDARVPLGKDNPLRSPSSPDSVHTLSYWRQSDQEPCSTQAARDRYRPCGKLVACHDAVTSGAGHP
jgi:hypothetical protein